jgi:hypothetical protein
MGVRVIETLLEVAKQYPVMVPMTIVVALLGFVWQLAITWQNFSYMRKNIVTRKDLENFKLKITLEFDERYLRRDSDPALHQTRAASGRG